jgi:hypothetical protein
MAMANAFLNAQVRADPRCEFVIAALGKRFRCMGRDVERMIQSMAETGRA